MKMQDIRKMYTEQVASLLAQGFQIYPDTMSSSQGEIAHVDLSNGTELLRVLLWEDRWDSELYSGGLRITVGECTQSFGNDSHPIIWNSDLTTRSEIKLARITSDWYTTPEQSKAAAELRAARWRSRERHSTRQLGGAYKAIGLRWLKRQPGMRSCRIGQIEFMRRTETSEGHSVYEICARGRHFIMR